MKGAIVHADFLEIRMDEKIQVAVPLVLAGESPGVKLGGTLSQLMRELEVECLPNAIPERIEVDVAEVDIGDVLHVRDLRLPEGVDLMADSDEPVLTVLAPVEEEEEAPEDELLEGEAAGADAPAPDAGEGDQSAGASAEESS